MWTSSGIKLTGKYGTWNGQEVELRSTAPADGMLLIVKYGGQAPGPEWMTIDLGNRFPISGTRHSLEVPANEVTDIHAVSAEGIFGSRCQVFVLAEDDKGNLAVEASAASLLTDKERLLSEHGFDVRPGDPLERTSVLGWLPAELVHDFKSEVVWRKDDDL